MSFCCESLPCICRCYGRRLPTIRFAAIFEHAARIGREQLIDELVRLNSDFARDLAGADRCSLWLIDPEHGELWTKVAHGVEPIRIPLGVGLVGACIRDDEVILINDAKNEPRLLRQVDEHSGYKTEQVLCVPMRAEGKVIGALQLLNKPSGFTETDAGLLGLLAHFAASAIDSERLRQEAEGARMIRHELALAHECTGQAAAQAAAGDRGVGVRGVLSTGAVDRRRLLRSIAAARRGVCADAG